MTDTESDVLEEAAAAWDMQWLLPFYRELLQRGFALNDVMNRMRALRELAGRPVERIDA
jgi:hypothetical protein